ncbi:DNA-binding protein [Apibacter muscae]|uniref:helix-turn-helix domain-containing protein n=1 Tax=Apibacter muscae TaxID=2509004 RepID=UPI0011AC515D|nr:helix-turn-helix domain-containing protein [Apibacter muscae]TWP23568.1 DNA-binding protein [Apibacter muscae]
MEQKVFQHSKGIKEVPNQHSKEVLSFKEALILLDISSSMLYKLTHQKLISYYKPNGKLIYFKREDLINWMLSNKQPSNEEVKLEVFNNLKMTKNASEYGK